MPLPANEDARANANFYIVQPGPNNHIPYTNATGVDIAAGDVVIIGALIGIADQDIANGAAGTLDIEDGAIANTAQVAAGSTFATIGQEVWYDPTTGEVQDTSANNLFGIGLLATILAADGHITFMKRRYWTTESFYTET